MGFGQFTTTAQRAGQWLGAVLLVLLPLLGWGQLALPASSPYSTDFNGVGTALPTGWSVYTGATASALGTATTFSTTSSSWANTTGQFANVAGYAGASSSALPAAQANYTNRALGLRQTSAFGDPGAAVTLQLANTSGRTGFSATFDFQMLNAQARITTFVVDYGLGAAPSAFTQVGTVTQTAAFGSSANTVSFGTALDNITGPVWIRIVALTTSAPASGSRQQYALDNFVLNWTTTPASPTIATSSVSNTPVCANAASNVPVSYATTGTLSGTYSAQLSDAAGSFASPTALVTVSEVAGTSITVTIPAGTASGTGYLIRVNNDNPATIGTAAAGTAFTISNLAVSVAPTTLGLTVGQTNATALTATETPAATSRVWKYGTASGGPYGSTISGQTGTSYTPQPADFGNTPNTYYVVVQSTLGGCVVTSNQATVTVSPATGATVVVTPNTLSLGTVATNTAGVIQTYAVSGSLLTTGITITPPAGVEISKDGFLTTANTNATPLVLPQSGGMVASITISVRLAAAASTGAVSGNIANVSGAASQSVAVAGTVALPATACTSNGFEGTFPGTGYVAGSGVAQNTSSMNTGAASAEFGTVGATLTLPVLANPSSLTFYLARSTNTTTRGLTLQASTSSVSGPYTTVSSFSSSSLASTAFVQFTADLSAYSGNGTVYLQFIKTGAASLLYLDDLVVTCGAAPAFALNTGSISGSPFCINQGSNPSISVPYTVSGGSFGTGNVFTAVLSDATGSFASGTTNLGTLNAVTSGTITGSIPASVSVTATAYRVRVQASTPATSATDNGSNLSVSNYQSNEVPSASATALAGNAQVTVSFGAPATCATGVIITARLGSAGTLKPLAGTSYTANTAFGSGTDLGGGQYVVYNGPLSSSVTVTGLSNGSQYFFQIFTTGGNGYSDGIVRSARPVVPATVTEVLVPQYISARSSSGAHATRLPYVWRVQLSNLTSGATYNYYTTATVSADPAGTSGAGLPLEAQVAGSFKRGTGPGFGLGSSFVADGNGSYTGWFALEPTADARYTTGGLLYPTVVLNDGQGGTVISQALRTSSTVTALGLATGAGNATGVQGSSFGTATNFVLTYDNSAAGSAANRPLAGTWLESDNTTNAAGTNGYATFYASSVDGVAGAWGLLTPNTNTNGIRRVEQRALADGSLVGCAATDADGIWPGGANTVSPSGGTTPLVFTTGDAPFQPATVGTFSPASGVAGATVTITGTNFTTGPRPTVSFNGGTPVTAATVNASGTSLTVAVPSGATTGLLTVTAGCGTAATTASSFTVIPTGFYTKPSGDVGLLASYGDQPDGSGTAPTSFTTTNQTFTITATTPNRTFASNWTVSGSNSKVVVAAGASLVVPSTATLTATVDVSGTFVVQNSTVSGISFGTLASGGTVDYAQTAGTFVVPTAPNYANLKLSNGNKRLGDLLVNGSLTFDNTQISGTVLNTSTSTASDYATVQLYGDFNQLAGTTYDATRNISLQLMNLGAVQSLNGNGNTIALYRLYTADTGANAAALGGRLTGSGSVLQVANSIDGGLALYQATASLALDASTTLRFAPGGGGNFFVGTQGLLKPDPAANLEFYRNTANSYTLGTLRLAAGFTTVNNFLLNSVAAGANTLTLTTDLTVNGTATLQAGTLIIGANTLTLNGTLAVATGGFLNGSSSSSLTVGGTGSFGSLAFASGAQLLNNLTMNRTGGTLTLAAPLTVGGTLALNNGIVTTAAASLLSLSTAATVVGGSASSFINGPLARASSSGAATVFFPIGKDVAYRPLTLNTAAQQNAVTFTAEQFNSTARTTALTGTGNTATPLSRVSSVRYFTLTPSATPGTYSGTVTLTFDTDDLVNYPGDATFVVAKRSTSSSAWGNFGRGSNTGTANNGQYVAGTLTSGSFTSFSDFALASTAGASNNALNTLNPLPVELTRFAAQRPPAHPAVELSWTTASEKNSAYFDVQRSLNGETFATVATVAAHGSSAKPSAYAAADASAPAAQLYYRLRQVDADGSVAYSPVVVVAAQALTQSALLYPNPARETIRLTVPAAASYRVLNVLGQPVLQGTVEAGEAPVPVAKLPAGAYYLELQTVTGRVVRKFVKE